MAHYRKVHLAHSPATESCETSKPTAIGGVGVGIVLVRLFTPQRPRSQQRRRVPFAHSPIAKSRGIPGPTTPVRTGAMLEWCLVPGPSQQDRLSGRHQGSFTHDF